MHVFTGWDFRVNWLSERRIVGSSSSSSLVSWGWCTVHRARTPPPPPHTRRHHHSTPRTTLHHRRRRCTKHLVRELGYATSTVASRRRARGARCRGLGRCISDLSSRETQSATGYWAAASFGTTMYYVLCTTRSVPRPIITVLLLPSLLRIRRAAGMAARWRHW